MKTIFYLLVVIAVLIFGIWFVVGNVHAWEGPSIHSAWGQYTYSDWSDCKPVAECGTSEGTQTRTKSRTCHFVAGYGINQCIPQATQSVEESRSCEVETLACPTQEPSATPSAEPSNVWSPVVTNDTTQAPSCNDASITANVVNPLVWRNGDQAKVQWWPTAGSQVNIYYKQVNSPVWQYSLNNQPNNGYAVINGLGTMDITFAVEQINGCSGGPVDLVKIVDGATNGWVLFTP